MTHPFYIKDLTNPDFFEQIGLRSVYGRSWVYKFGRVATQLGKTAPVWDGNDNYIFPENAGSVSIASTELDDVDQGVGAWSVHIYGLDENWEMQSEIIAINGTSVHDYIRVFRMHVELCGTGDFPYNGTQIGNNVGDIIATHADTLSPIAIVQAGRGQTLMTIYTIPKGYVGLMWAAKVETGKGKEATGILYTKDNRIANSPWRTKGIRDMYQNTVGNDFVAPNPITEMTDVLLAVHSISVGDNVTATFQIELVKKELYNDPNEIE